MIQVVTDRLSSSYDNILLVYDITALLGNSIYNCSIGSNDQYVYGVIDEGLTGIYILYTYYITTASYILIFHSAWSY